MLSFVVSSIGPCEAASDPERKSQKCQIVDLGSAPSTFQLGGPMHQTIHHFKFSTVLVLDSTVRVQWYAQPGPPSFLYSTLSLLEHGFHQQVPVFNHISLYVLDLLCMSKQMSDDCTILQQWHLLYVKEEQLLTESSLDGYIVRFHLTYLRVNAALPPDQ
jgi:hypothetical protein